MFTKAHNVKGGKEEVKQLFFYNLTQKEINFVPEFNHLRKNTFRF